MQRLDERDYVSVVVFDDRIDVLAGAQTASEANKAAIVEKLRKNLARKLVNRIVLLSRRQKNRRYFTTVRDIDFAGRTWHAYGNAELLDLPVLEPFRCSRSWAEGGPEWSEALARAESTGPGGAGGCSSSRSTSRRPRASTTPRCTAGATKWGI